MIILLKPNVTSKIMFNLIKIFKPEIIKVLVFLLLFSVTFVYAALNRNDKTSIEFINKIIYRSNPK